MAGQERVCCPLDEGGDGFDGFHDRVTTAIELLRNLGDSVYLTEVSALTTAMVGEKADAMAESSGTRIDLGTQEVSVTVEVRWEIR